MQVKSSVSREEKIQRQFEAVQAGFIKRSTSLYKFCKAKGIDKGYAFRALKEQRTTPKAKELKKFLIKESREKTKFSTEQSRSTTE